MWTKQDMPGLTSKTALVTGANTGIGYETALALYEAGAQVVVAGRDDTKVKQAIEKMKRIGGEGVLEAGKLDLTSLKSVKLFADDFKNKHAKLDLLINNAGVMLPPATATEDGFELQFGVNFLGHFALSAHLLSVLQKASNARVVTVTSGAATLADGIDFANLRLENPYDALREYATSKLANVLFAYELAHKLQASGNPVVSVAAHPGVSRTDLQRHIPEADLQVALSQFPEVMEPWQGALPTLYAATELVVKNGELYGPDGVKEYAGYPALSKHTSAAMTDANLARKLWEYSEKVIGTNFIF